MRGKFRQQPTSSSFASNCFDFSGNQSIGNCDVVVGSLSSDSSIREYATPLAEQIASNFCSDRFVIPLVTPFAIFPSLLTHLSIDYNWPRRFACTDCSYLFSRLSDSPANHFFLVRRRPPPDSRDGVQKLPKERQAELIRILKAQPTVRAGLQATQEGPQGKRKEWLIGRAGYWPDVAPSQPEFNRPEWHYQLGSCLNIGKRQPASVPCPLPADATAERSSSTLPRHWN